MRPGRGSSIEVSYAALASEAQRRFGWKLFTAMRYLATGEVERVHTSDGHTSL